MSRFRVGSFAVSLVCLASLGSLTASAQEMPKPTPEHAFLKGDVGTWDATVEMWMGPGTEPVKSTGTETVWMLGEFWQIQDFESTFMGQPFRGRGQTGFDPVRKLYVSSWIDSSSPGISHGEGRYDAATRTLTGTMVGPGPDGKPEKMKETIVWTDADNRVFTMLTVGTDGKDVPSMRITYKRRK